MSKKAVYVRGPDNVYYRKEKSPSVSSGSSDSIGRRRSEVDNMLNELMECGFQVEKKPDADETVRKEKPAIQLLPRPSPAKPQAEYPPSPVYSIPSIHPYTTAWKTHVPPFLAGMLATYLLQLGLPSIQYCMGALATLLKWAAVWGVVFGGVMLYAGVFPELRPLVERFRLGYFRRVTPIMVEPEPESPSEYGFRPPVPSKKTPEHIRIAPEPKREEASVTNVRAFRAQLRHTNTSASIDTTRSEGGSPSVQVKTDDPRSRMRRAFTEGAPPDNDSSSSGRFDVRRKVDFGYGSDSMPSEVARHPRNSRNIIAKSARAWPNAPNRRQSASSLSYDSAPPVDDLPFSFEMKMKDSDNFSLGRSDTTATKHSVLGTRANYSKFLANVDH